jgi:hypothetical protein
MRRLLPVLLLLAAACGSSSGNRPADVAKPDISVRQVGDSLFFGSLNTAPMSIDIHIRNNATVPLLVREIEVRSPGMMQYTLQRYAKTFHETIPPGESRTLGLVATVYANNPRAHSTEPLTVQAVVRFEANGRGFREIKMEQAAGPGL